MKKKIKKSLGVFVAGLILILAGFSGYFLAGADSVGTVNTIFQATTIALYVGGGLILLSIIMFVIATSQAGKES